jgi:3-oxosteroid 1-dehydrogenase
MPAIAPLQSEYDLVIVGSGGGSMTAALVARQLGKRVVILEKMDAIGGSTSFSGGVWWVPNSPLLAEARIPDSFEKAREYFDSVVTYKGPGVTPERRDAFLKGAPKMISFLRGLGLKVRRPRDDWPDYYDDLPGGLPQGRSLMADPFDMRELGEWKDHLAMYPPMLGMPIGAEEFTKLFLVKRTMAGKLKALRFALQMAKTKLSGSVTVANGAAIQGRMLQIALREGVELQISTSVKRLIVEEGRVVGVIAQQGGKDVEVRARDGVIVNVGGFSRNKAFREKVTDGPITNEWTNANPGDTGEVIQAMMDIGAATDCLDTAWWVVTSRGTDGTWPEGAVWKDGRVLPFMHHLDISLPFVILVDQQGRRVADESGAYMEMGERIFQRERETGKAVPCWAIFAIHGGRSHPARTRSSGSTAAT